MSVSFATDVDIIATKKIRLSLVENKTVTSISSIQSYVTFRSFPASRIIIFSVSHYRFLYRG